MGLTILRDLSSLIGRAGRKLLQPEIDKAVLTEEHAYPDLAWRSIFSEHPADRLTPARLATVLREAEQGMPRLYLELAQDLEERWPQYRSVVNTRRIQISQLDVTVTPASDTRADQDDADLVRSMLVDQPWFRDLLFDLLDGISVGYAIAEIVWETSARQWRPAATPWRDPRWFRPDLVDGTTLRLEDGSPTGADLPPYKYIVHRPKTKSGLPVRGGLARPAGWLYCVGHLTLADWAVFVGTCGFPVRLGKYGPGASAADKATLLRAVRSIARDAAAIIPSSMEMTFERVASEGGKGGGDVWERLITYADQQASKLVLGQTATTDAIAGGHAVGAEHNDVRSDIERSDARQLAATLTRDLIVPFLTLNRGPRPTFPTLMIGRPQAVDVAGLSEALAALVPLGLRVKADEVRRLMGLANPIASDEVLAPQAIVPPPPVFDTAAARTLATVAAAVGTRADPDAITEATDDLLAGDGWRPVAVPLVDPVTALLGNCASLEEARDRLASLLSGSPDPEIVETLARLMASARLAGLAGAALAPGAEPEPGRVRRD